ncbi:transcription antitermination factor NusB [Truepera radiovictrix]|uniref:Transcription antitermination protein NusB n=1 Tax=Truepera radiovictrix (strain DSM 17093 / CIP 108686 / LMG 22925 / RQ-24) TaxID=649638 RepID=D7CVY2_TRURR|nr:transcription antitermination factor NusB [Truepera radiovictrix]ADI14245.1 NusB antitermination factor [Truepera radiovictrix DSM 17093]WMT57198.1 transcription antitermination factor NusB [Truepera radiovictrix]
MARRRARELAFRALFQSERGGEPLLEVWEGIRDDVTEQPPDEAEEAYGDPLEEEGLAFAERLLRAFHTHREEVDARLSEALEGWTFAQMAQTDLAVLRLALTEILFEPEVPKEVTIEVAVRIAKRYGGEESGRFVNGVLGRLYREVRGDAPGGEGASPLADAVRE